jgi:hypothetical protein
MVKPQSSSTSSTSTSSLSSSSSYNPSISSSSITTLTTRETMSASMPVVENKILAAATANLKPHIIKLLGKQSNQNAITISQYVYAMNTEINPSASYGENQLKVLCYLSDLHKQKPFLEKTRDDVLQYLVKNIPSFKRKEQSIYKPTDLWTEQDDALFLKYCPNKRDRCYHMVAHDSSCRPSEILGLKIKL